jgi:hypothetical protein
VRVIHITKVELSVEVWRAEVNTLVSDVIIKRYLGSRRVANIMSICSIIPNRVNKCGLLGKVSGVIDSNGEVVALIVKAELNFEEHREWYGLGELNLDMS